MAMDTRFLVSKVLELIFSNLGRTDLLNIRLVCKDWNQDCLNFFKKSAKFQLILDHVNWNDYIQFVSSTSTSVADSDHQQMQIQPQPVMPIFLKFKALGEGGSDSYSDISEEDNEDEGDYFLNIRKHNTRKFQELALAVKKFQNLFGSDCIKGLDFIYPGTYGTQGFAEELVNVLSDLSPGLEKLEIELDCDCEFPSKEEDWIVFPKVKHLKFKFCRRNYPPLEGNKTPWKLIQACPNLEILILGKMHEMDTTRWPSELPFPPSGIKSLELDHFPTDWLLNKMQEHPSLPTLQKLSLSSGFCIIGNDDDQEIKKIHNCREILRLFSPSLRTLSMRLNFHDLLTHEIRLEKKKDAVVYKVPFPLFPALRNLTIKDLNFWTDRIGTSFKIDPASFPALESVTIPFNLNLNDEKNEPEVGQFSHVKFLSLGCDLDEDEDSDDENEDESSNDAIGNVYEKRNTQIQGKFKHLHSIFPNISTVEFYSDKYEGLEYGVFIKHYLKIYVQLPEASKIQVLEISGFHRNYLGELLEQIHYQPRLVLENVRRNPLLDDEFMETFKELTGNFGFGSEVRISEEVGTLDTNGSDLCLTTAKQIKNLPVKNCMTNIRKIRLVLNEETRVLFIKEFELDLPRSERSDYRQELDAPKKLYLNEMMANFPNLEQIEVSSHFFGRNAVGFGRAERIKRIREKFPGLKISII